MCYNIDHTRRVTYSYRMVSNPVLLEIANNNNLKRFSCPGEMFGSPEEDKTIIDKSNESQRKHD